MSFQLPSAASRGVVSILNDGQDASNRNHNLVRPEVVSLTTCESPKAQSPQHMHSSVTPNLKPNDPSANSYSSVSSSATQQSSTGSYSSSSRDRSGNSTDVTSLEPSPQPYAIKSLQREDDDKDGDRMLTRPHLGQPSWIETDGADYDRMDTSGDCSGLQRSSSSSSFMGPQFQGQDSTSGSGGLVAGKKRYPCTHAGCDKTFSTSGHAARHNRIHTGQKPYRCTFPGCKATFSRQDNALAHFRTGHALAKQRGGNNYSIEGVAASPSEADMAFPVDQTDAEHLASVQLGRKALEEGTAIAVVREGRVERTVGLPTAKRPMGSNTQGRTRKSSEGPESCEYASHSEAFSKNGHSPISYTTPAAEYAQNRSAVSRFANGESPQTAAIRQVELPRSFRGPASISSSSSSSSNASTRMHPYYSAASSAHRGSFSSLQEPVTNGRARLLTASLESGASPIQYTLPSPSSGYQRYPSHVVISDGSGIRRSGSHSLHTTSTPLASSIGFRRGSGTGSSAAGGYAAGLPPILPSPSSYLSQPYPSTSHRAPSSTSSASSTSVSPSIMGQWSSMRLDGVASNVRAQRTAAPALNAGGIGQQQLRFEAAPSSSASSVSPAPATSNGATSLGEAGRSASPTSSSRPESSSSSIQSPDSSSDAMGTSTHPLEAQKQATQADVPKFRLPVSSGRFAAQAGRGSPPVLETMGRDLDRSEGLKLPPLRLPA